MKLIDTILDILTESKYGNSKLPKATVVRRLKRAKELAPNFSNPRQFELKHRKLWNFLRLYGFVDEVFPNRQKYGNDFTHEKVKELASGFVTPLDFQTEHPTAFKYAYTHKMLHDLFPNSENRLSAFGAYLGNKDDSPYHNKSIQKHFDDLMDRASSQYKDMDDLKKRNPGLHKQLVDLGHDYVPEDMMERLLR